MLPSLPDVWANGSVKGLVARGNFEVSMKWADKNLTEELFYQETEELQRFRQRMLL